MDAGLAAVLGAAVGAIGTGGAGIGAALLARSQARSQLKAEHARSLREPRRVAYMAFAETMVEDQNALSTATSHLQVVARNEHPGAREELLNRAREAYDSLESNEHHHAHRYAQVVVEGPPRVSSAASDARVAFTEFKSQVFNRLIELKRGQGSCPDMAESLGESLLAAHKAYIDFVHAAALAMTADGVDRLPE
ncbi:hypothetical protein [Streptomyces sp. Tue6028]|uniref:hypothetical protein n=1 Tax=Streptomyces sp. Tue6028 TaxID=2036037 RepID=UPI003EC002F3